MHVSLLIWCHSGYYAEKTTAGARELLSRKCKLLEENIDQLYEALQLKSQSFDTVQNAMRDRMTRAQAEQQQAASRQAALKMDATA